MGDLTRAELREEVQANLGNRTDDPSPSRVDRSLHIAQTRIARRKGWNFNELDRSDSVSVTVSGDVSADLTYDGFPSNLRGTYSLRRRDSDGLVYRIRAVPPRLWDRTLASSTNVTREWPVFYTMWNKTVEWHPVPNAAFTLLRRYSIWPTDFVDDNAVSDLDKKDDAIVALTTHMLFQGLGRLEDSARWFVIFNNIMGEHGPEDKISPDFEFTPQGFQSDRPSIIPAHEDPFAMEDR